MNIGKSGDGPRAFDHDELRRVHENASTESLMNHAAHEAHVLDRSLSLHGNDLTRRELAAEQKEGGSIAEVVEVGLGLNDAIEASGLEAPLALVAPGTLGIVAAPIASFVLAFHNSIHRPAAEGEAQNAAIKREQMHVALTAVLALPEGYKIEQNAVHAEIPRGFGSIVMRLCEGINAEKGTLAVLQLHCDQGMNAARMMIASSGSSPADQTRFLAAHPEVAEKKSNDAAFAKGFDALVWARDHGQLDVAIKALNERDARYDAAHVAYSA